MIEPNAAALSYVRFVLDSLMITPTSLAKKVGISATTLTRPLNDPNYKFAISTTTIAKIAKYSGINPGPFFESNDVAERHIETVKGYGSRIGISDEDRPIYERMMQSTLPIVGEIGDAEVWQYNEMADLMDYGSLYITYSNHNYGDVFGIAVIGNGANMIANPGEFLLCRKCNKIETVFGGTDFYVVQDLDETNKYMHLSVYFTMLSDDELEPDLHLASHDRHPDDIIRLREMRDGSDPAKIIGKVDYVFRQPQPLKKMQ